MSARPAVLQQLLPAVIAIAFIPFTPHLQAQCHTAHNPADLRALQDKASAGDADAQCGMGMQYEYALGVPQDNNQAVLWLRKSADQGNLSGQTELGVVFSKMHEYEQALTWYRKAAEKGYPRAQFNLGLAYQNGEAVPKDMSQAIAWYRKAADQGDVAAQLNLGVAYDQGLGGAQDYLQAADWYRKAADQGLAEAQYGLGYLYLNGNGVPKDAALAANWMLKAAEQGETYAAFNLGVCYTNGTCTTGAGVDQDISEGYFWMLLASARTTDTGLKAHAGEALEATTKAMKKSDIKAAQKRAQTWLNDHPVKAQP